MQIEMYLLYTQQDTTSCMGNNKAFYRSFIGSEGRRQAVMAFFEKVLKLDTIHRIQMLDQENYIWFREEPVFF